MYSVPVFSLPSQVPNSWAMKSGPLKEETSYPPVQDDTMQGVAERGPCKGISANGHNPHPRRRVLAFFLNEARQILLWGLTHVRLRRALILLDFAGPTTPMQKTAEISLSISQIVPKLSCT